MTGERRLIDANRIVETAERAYNAWNLAMAAADGKREINRVYKMQELCKAVKAVAEDCQTIDAVEVTRCISCRHHDADLTDEGRYFIFCTKLTLFESAEVPPDFYCGFGEPEVADNGKV